MKTSHIISLVVLAAAFSGCSNGFQEPGTFVRAPQPAKPTVSDRSMQVLPDRIATVPTETVGAASPQSVYADPSVTPTIDVGAYGDLVTTSEVSAPAQMVSLGAYDAAPSPSFSAQSQAYAQPLPRGTMAPVRDDPLDSGSIAAVPRASRATSYNVAALKAAYHPSEALSVPAPRARVRNVYTPEFGRRLSSSALARLNPNVRYVADYKEISYPWGDVSETTGVCTDVVIRSYRSLGIDLQSMVHEDMRRAFAAYPSRKIYGLKKADPNIDHRRVVNLEAFFERVGAGLAPGSAYQPGDVVTWRLSGGEPHIGVVVDQRDVKTGNFMIVHNLGAGVQVEDLLDYAPAHGHYRFAPDAQSRMASLALRRG